MTENATPGEIFLPVPLDAKEERIACYGSVTKKVRIIGQLGSVFDVFDVQNGGQGEVYFCLEKKDESFPDPSLSWAIKLLPRHVLLNPVRRRAFLRECMIAVQLAALPGFIDSTVIPIRGMPAIAMPGFLRGSDGLVNLRDLLRRPSIPLNITAFLGWCLADSMAMAAERLPGLVHGDLKPENVLMQAGIPFITDFGLARTARDDWGRDHLAGTPTYLAPEGRVSGSKLTKLTDVFAFGRIMEEMLAKQDDGWDEARGQAEEFARRCVSVNPTERPQGFREVADRLRGMFDESDEAIAHLYQTRQILGMHTVSFSAIFPNPTLESLLRLEQWDLLHEAVEKRPVELRTARLWHFHGLALTRMGRDDEGLVSLEQALAKARQEVSKHGHTIGWSQVSDESDLFQEILYDIAILLINTGQYDDAEEIGQLLIDNADSPGKLRQAILIVAMVAARRGEFGKAERLFRKATSEEYDSDRLSVVLMHWAEMLAQQGWLQQAVDQMQHAISLSPGKARNHRILGELLLFKVGDAAFALTAFDHAQLCGDLSEEVLVMRLSCEILLAGQKSLDEIRRAAEEFHGKSEVESAWTRAMDLVSGAQRIQDEVREVDTSPGPERRTFDFGELQVEIDDVGFYTFDFYYPHNDDDYLTRLALRYREITLNINATMRGTPITLTQCISCTREVTTNRPSGTTFLCSGCHSLITVAPLISARYNRLQQAMTVALDRQETPVDSQACCVIIQPIAAYTSEQADRVRSIAREHGLQPVEPFHPAVLNVYSIGVANGSFRMRDEPIGAIYEFPTGSLHNEHLTPQPVEEYLMEVRRFFNMRVDSCSARMNWTAGDFFGLMLADRLDEAEEITEREVGTQEKLRNYVDLSYMRLVRGDVAGAARNAADALRIDGNAATAWVASGYAELLAGDLSAARSCANRALELSEALSSALALLATVEYQSGESPDVVWPILARAVTMGALQLPRD
jgi:tetratricopeptide (TPR) repeat protein